MYHEFRNNSNKDGQKTSCPEDLKMTEVNLFVFKDRVLLYVIFVGQELTMCIRPALSHKDLPAYFQNAEIKGMHHHTQPNFKSMSHKITCKPNSSA